MANIIIDLFEKMKVGAMYHKLMKENTIEHINNNPKLVIGAQIKYVAQSTFHTIE